MFNNRFIAICDSCKKEGTKEDQFIQLNIGYSGTGLAKANFNANEPSKNRLVTFDFENTSGSLTYCSIKCLTKSFEEKYNLAKMKLLKS